MIGVIGSKYPAISIHPITQSPTMAIADWPEDQRPRERLIRQGPHVLSDYELLAVFLRVGVSGKSAVDLGRDMVGHFGSLNRLFCASLADFSAINGLGPAKYAQFQAVLELARRALAEELEAGITLSSPQAVRQYLQLLLSNRSYESFIVLFLDVKNRLIAGDELFRGTLTHASVYPREVVKAALAHNAASVIIAHNHPSGSPDPSAADHALTQALKQALALVDVRVLDHFVVAGRQVYSFAEHGEI
jgi:DNA repair protein RadC